MAYTKFADLEKYGDEYCITRAPFQIPESVREFLVKFGPYAMIAFPILSLLAYFNLYRVYSQFPPYAMMLGSTVSFWTQIVSISLLITLIALGFQIKAFSGLMARKKEGWEYTVYATLISLIPSLINVRILSLIIGFVVGMYILFQLKYMYK